MRARGTSYLLISFLCILCISCGSIAGITAENLIPLVAIKTAEDAQRALIVAQDVRFSAMRVIKYGSDNGSLNPYYMESFKAFDEKFRKTWDWLDKVVMIWKLSGKKPVEFEPLYRELQSHSDNIQLIAGGMYAPTD